MVEVANSWSLSLDLTHSFRLVVSERIAESIVEFERYDGFGQLIEISSQNVCRIMYSVACPIQAFAISIWRVKGFS
jgi:hypothetical protein